MSELKTCPFCGNEHVTITQNYGYWHIGCPQCQTAFENDGTCGRNKDKEKTIAAWNRRANGWIPVSERLPESGKHVFLSCQIKPSGKKYVCDGFYVEHETIVGSDLPDDTDLFYSEEKDEYYLPEGFYEVIKNWDDYGSITIGDFVTHWMPLPEPPEGVDQG
ncbi:MAG: hypothetical protein AWM53_01994 [Candidatus Dichloromethanomonas elyunquensis]|nr:MAG: hypothetical protein AWM53_01994 [Candidatus Dichloromethanomonas elyunquensis]